VNGSTVYRNARVDGTLVDLTCSGGRIDSVTPSGPAPVGAPAGVDLEGRVVLPPFANGHAHLDKTFWTLPWRPHVPGGSIRDRIDRERTIRADGLLPDGSRALALARGMLEAGVGVIRSHVDVDTLVRLGGLEAVDSVRRELGGLVDLQIVAFPQSGILKDPGVADLMAEALSAGADVVGGLDPLSIDDDVDGHLDVVFDLAERFSAPVDIHLHDGGPEGMAEIAAIVDRTAALGLRGRVTVSHAYTLGTAPTDDVRRLAERLAEWDVAIMTDGPVGTTPPVRLLHDAGVTVMSGSDGIRDAWTPYGVPGMSPIAKQLAYQSKFYEDADLELVARIVTAHGARVLGVEGHGLAPGSRADFVVLDAGAVAEVVAEGILPSVVVRAGGIVQLGRPAGWIPVGKH
jgi:cytosine deaminase